MSIVIAAFYRFTELPDYCERREPLHALCQKAGLRGTILLAPEGINGTVSGPRAGIDALAAALRAEPCFADLEYKESQAESHPFKRLKVRLKKEIVTMGMPDTRIAESTGVRVGPVEWNALLDDPDVTVIDTRNHYEYGVGTFDNAISPDTRSFRQFPAFVGEKLDPERNPRIAMFCTGGIRCEKASAWLLRNGFREVYQLNGGILRYLAEVEPEQNRWRGECFVFDERGAVDASLQPPRSDNEA